MGKCFLFFRFALLSMALAPGFSMAQVAETLTELQALALQRDPDYRVAEFSREALLEQYNQNVGALMPTFNLEASTTGTKTMPRGPSATGGQTNTSFNTKRWELSLTQPIFRAELFVNRIQADVRLQQADAELAAARQDLIVRLAERYFSALRAADDLGLAQAEAEALKKQLELAKDQLEFGLVAITDVNEAQAAFDTALARILDAESTLSSARDQLAAISGVYPEGLAPLGEKLPLIVPAPSDIALWSQAALDQNHKLRAANLNVEAARQEIRKAEAGHLPSLDLVFKANSEAANGGIGGASDYGNESVALQLTIPLFRGGQILSRTRETVAQHAQAIERAIKERRTVEREAREAYVGVSTNIMKVRAQERAVHSHESAVEAVKESYQLRHRTAIDVLTAQNKLYLAKRDLSAARYEYVLNVLRLKRAAGSLQDADSNHVNGWLDLSKRVGFSPNGSTRAHLSGR
ncbi:MAG: TolC family outer membrane protein [Sulfuritalea sp.]|nr:TolC family outer membrane protein [Sulfuritalea sp.]